MDIQSIKDRLRPLGNRKNIQGMARFGITPKRTFGVSMPDLIDLSREIGRDHELALDLWNEGIRETMILGALVDDVECVTEEQMERWVLDLDYWEICDQVIMKLFERTPFAEKKAFEWVRRDEEFVKRAGFVLMARMPRVQKAWDDVRFIPILDEIEKGARDDRHNVKKAVNRALREIGKKNLTLNRLAIERAEIILEFDNSGAKWIARDALNELRGSKVQERLRKRERT